MTTNEINIAIAEACGWSRTKEADGSWTIKSASGEGCNYYPQDIEAAMQLANVPNYLNDLNAMHEAEKVFFASGVPASRWEAYDNMLAQSCGGFARAHATAAQRAQAFLRTIGKWKE
jgi:hypothetical protein